MAIIRKTIIIAAITMAAQAAMAGYGAAPVTGPLSERVEKLELMMGGESSGSVSDQVVQLQRDIQELRGQLEEANHQISRLSQRQQDLYSDLDARISQIKQPASKTTVSTR